MDEELVTLTGRFVDVIEGIKIHLPLAPAYGDTLATRQPDVVAPLLFHTAQQRLLLRPDIQHPLVSYMRGIRIGPEALSPQHRQPCRISIRDARLSFEHESIAFPGLSPDVVQQ